MAPQAPRTVWQRSKMLVPFLWPKDDCFLQLRVVCCLILLGIVRMVTVGVPVIYKRLIDHMTKAADVAKDLVTEDNTPGFHITSSQVSMILLYIVVKSMVGSYGYLNVLRSYLWLPVSQRTHKTLRVVLFEHILNLSLSWHLRRKTGEVLRVVDRGVTSVEHVLNEVVFSMVPAVADVIISLVFFMSFFDLVTGIVVGTTMVGYVGCSLVLTKWKYTYRRDRNTADNLRQAAIVDAILNFETVKYYSAESWEVRRYNDALEKHMQAEWLVNMAAELRWCARRTMMSLGLAIGSVLCAVYVNQGTFTVGDYVLFVSYLEQVYVPLNSIGDYYKRMQQATIDMENMFDILEEQPDIVDAADAKPLQIFGGKIEFRSVDFSYTPDRPLLRDLSWSIEPGKTLALVGQSGSGKSTILRLLLRFYDVSSGSVLIDDQDVRSVTQQSLRQLIGVVPQDTVLFNKDIEYNIRYGRPDATDEEVVEAALSSNIHKRILSFPEGYSTKVGERGLKLSGGEKQRVAIARTVLKRAKIIILDEATSALDTKTERNIQAAFNRVCQDKTTIIVAHRLSTIVHADLILVLENGRVVEQGNHEQLVAACGRYAEMWSEQLRRRNEDEDFVADLEADDEWSESSNVTDGVDPNTLVRKRKIVAVEDGIRYIPRV